MGSVSTSEFEVKKSKSRKRAKKKEKIKEIPQLDSTVDEKDNNKVSKNVNDGNTLHKKRGRKRKSNETFQNNGTEEDTTNNSEQGDASLKVTKQDQSETALNDEGKTLKRVKKESITQNDNNKDVVDEQQEVTKDETKTPKKPSKRQLKREKAEQRETEKREASRIEATEKALNYVSKWKHARSEWKFEKLRQIWLMDNLLDENSIPDSIFPTVLEYFEGCKGMAREQLLKKGMDVIKTIEEDEEKKDEIMESVAYRRARKLLQAIPTET